MALNVWTTETRKYHDNNIYQGHYTLRKKVPKRFFLSPVGRTLKGSQYKPLKVLWTPWGTLFGSLKDFRTIFEGSIAWVLPTGHFRTLLAPFFLECIII